ncbi:MAG: helicase [Chitinophagaceae bacterium]|nr:MAG: helicase [Chitinophagaceae bacterium]
MNQFKTDPENTLFQLAANFVNHTSRPVFLTGKAGTGKTTFLKYIRESTLKQTVVAAPTGVAAINAGGVTLHSFFQLPFGPFIPVTANSFENAGHGITDQHSLFRNIRFFSSKRKILEEMELLIIDEISMVRADMLDAVDIILRQFRRNLHQPFGGVQVLLIGDLFQLPPVVPHDQWEILKHYYESPFFFHSKVMKQDPPVYIELKKIYRQNDQHFIDILNRVRHNTLTEEDYTILNGLYDPFRQSIEQDRFITLTSHNHKADSINVSALERLTDPAFTFEAAIDGDFPEKSYPTDYQLTLRKGAQVMFVKNETGELKRYFNGKLAIVTSVNDKTIVVQLADSLLKMELEKETWTNIRYSYNQETGEIEEEEIGSFTQYPVRLAWAITIHKSQGLTFEKAIIDAGNAFAPGQVYVALSRCTTLGGIVLHSKVHPGAIKTDEEVARFAQHEADEQRLSNALHAAQHTQGINSLHKYFDCIKLMEACQHYHKTTRTRKHAEKLSSLELANNLIAGSASLQSVADKFSRQLIALVSEFRKDGDLTPLTERVGSGINYFSATIESTMLVPVKAHNERLRKNKKTAKYCKEMDALEVLLRKKIALMNHAGDLITRLAGGALAEN